MSNSQVAGHDGASHGSLKSYVVGFVLSIIFTLISFWLVMSKQSHDTAVIGVVVFCIVQLLVQLIFFMHLGSASAQQNRSIFLFTVLVLVILVGGSVYIMAETNALMMPGMMGKM